MLDYLKLPSDFGDLLDVIYALWNMRKETTCGYCLAIMNTIEHV